MIALGITATIALVAIGTLLITVRMLLRTFTVAQEHWQTERRELLTRIQRPEIVPVARAESENVQREVRLDDWHKVGSVEVDPEYGLTDG